MLLNRSFFAVALIGTALLCSTASAQFRGGGGGRGGPGGGPGGLMGNSSLGLINDKNVVAELELVEDQVEALNDLQDDMRNIFRDSFSGMRDKFRDENADREALMDEVRDKIQSEMKNVESELNEILLPHQVARLEELSFQMQASRAGTTGLLSNPKVKDKLGLTDDQIDEVKAKSEEVRKDLDAKIEKLREEARNEILSVLSPDQQTQIKEMMGDSFQFEERGGRGRGGDRGGAGGRGGDRGGPGGRGRGGDRGGRDGGRPEGE